MKKKNMITFFAAMVLSYQAFAANPTFEVKMKSVLDKYNLTLGKDEKITLKGENCVVTVYNVSKLSSMFPKTSKANQRLEVTVQINENAAKFKLNRESVVTEYSAGKTILNIAASNKTGIGSGRMRQSLELIKSVGPNRALTTKVVGFGGDSLACVTNAVSN